MADHIEMLKKIKKVAGILRISTDKTDFEGNKVESEETLRNHEIQMTTFFKEWNIELVLYKEVLSGGSEFEDRKELQRALKDIQDEKQNFNAVCVIEMERFARDTFVSAHIKKAVENSCGLIISLSPFQILDLNDSNDSLMFGLASVIAEHNRKIASNRVKLNKIAMARQGLNSSGSVPLGYVRNPATKRLEIEKDENGNEAASVKTVRQIFNWYMEGEGQRTICDRLNSMGIKNKNGNTWIPNSLRVLLTCETYKGTLIARNFVKRKGKMVENLEDRVVIEGNHDAIIDPEAFDRAQQLRGRKKERSGIDQRNHDWNSKKHMSILDGLLYCGCPTCGRKSTIKWYSDKEAFYIIKCSKFNASGKTCNNGGYSEKDAAKQIFEQIESYKAEIEKRLLKVKSNDLQERKNELQDLLEIYEQQKKSIENDYRVVYRQEQEYLKQEKKDEFEGELIQEDKLRIAAQRQAVLAKIEEVQGKLAATPSPEKEVKRLQRKIDIIEELQTKEFEEKQVNALLKEIILKINYTRVLPDDSRKFSKTQRDLFPATFEIEYID